MASWQGFKDWMVGGTSKDPSEFRQDYAHQGQIDQAIGQGLGTNRTAPQSGVDGQFRNAQVSQLGQLQGLASGQQQTAGELAAMRAAQQAGAQQQAMARMARGGDAVLAQRTAANQTAGIASNAAGQAQRSALEGQMQAHGLMSQVAGQARGQDMQIQLANMDARLKQMGMDDQQRQFYLQQLSGMDMNSMNQQMASYNQAAANPGMLGSLLSAGGQLGAAYMGMPQSTSAPTMSRIATGNPGAGGYYTPTSTPTSSGPVTSPSQYTGPTR